MGDHLAGGNKGGRNHERGEVLMVVAVIFLVGILEAAAFWLAVRILEKSLETLGESGEKSQ